MAVNQVLLNRDFQEKYISSLEKASLQSVVFPAWRGPITVKTRNWRVKVLI